MTEIDRLRKRLSEPPWCTSRNMHVTWGPEVEGLTPEERAAEVNRLLDAVERGEYTPLEPEALDRPRPSAYILALTEEGDEP